MQLEMFGHVNSVPDQHYFTVSFAYTIPLPSFLSKMALRGSSEGIHCRTKKNKYTLLNSRRKPDRNGFKPKGEIYAWKAQSQTVSANGSSVDVEKVLTGFFTDNRLYSISMLQPARNKTKKNHVKLITSPLVQLTVCLAALPHTCLKASTAYFGGVSSPSCVWSDHLYLKHLCYLPLSSLRKCKYTLISACTEESVSDSYTVCITAQLGLIFHAYLWGKYAEAPSTGAASMNKQVNRLTLWAQLRALSSALVRCTS